MIFNKMCRGHFTRTAVKIKIILTVLLVLAGSAGAITVTVDAGGGANYTNIQEAINATSNGDTILVNSGMYQENVNVNKQLILKGMDTGTGKPVVDASGSGNAVTLSAGNSTLDGFIVTNGSLIGIVVSSDFNILSNNSAMNNTENGIVLTNASNNTLNNNGASSNAIFGIALLDGSNFNILSGSNVLNNGNAGIFLRESSGNILNNNTANSNNIQGIQLLASIINILINNTVTNSDYGIYLESSSDNNILGGNTANMNSINGIFLTGSSNNTIFNNHFNNTNNFGVSGSNTWNTTITNGTNIIGGPYTAGNYWANPNGTGFSQTCPDTNNDGICDSTYMLDVNNIDYLPLAYNVTNVTPVTGPVHNINKNTNYTTIQAAINDASPGDEIQVESGTYRENVNVNKQLILKGMDTGTGKPVVDASGSADAINLSSGNSTLDGFEAINGSIGIAVTSDINILSDNSAMNNTENGIVLTNASNNTLNNNSASSNAIFGIALLDGSNFNILSGSNVLNNGNAGIFLRESSGNILNNNTANSNNIQGIQLLASIKNILINNTVSNNDYGIYLESSSDNNILSSNNLLNNGNGVFLTGSSNNTIYNNHFNNTNNFDISGSNTWNTTLTSGMNIIRGPNIGGNYWANPNGTGFSQTCTDGNGDGICDSTYMLDVNNIDYLPLAPRLIGDLNGNGVSADAGDLVLMKRASIGEIPADSRYDLNNNGMPADAGDLVLMKRASIGEINL